MKGRAWRPRSLDGHRQQLTYSFQTNALLLKPPRIIFTIRQGGNKIIFIPSLLQTRNYHINTVVKIMSWNYIQQPLSFPPPYSNSNSTFFFKKIPSSMRINLQEITIALCLHSPLTKTLFSKNRHSFSPKSCSSRKTSACA